MSLPVQLVDSTERETRAAADTLLPHWGPLQRTIHRLCRRSRAANTAVAAIEMRLGREELLSLPQYMALCPTGQCNALCGFCSVTTNRTGIIKKQLPFDAISRFTGPVSRVIRMYGLEGNGEPTLYDRFDELADALLRNGATAYLITNGDRLTPAGIDALVARGLDAVNFSLNAASGSTHRRIMKLRDFDRVLSNIRRFVAARGTKPRPSVSVSMVVTRDNVHEVVPFLRLAEEDLGVDRVLVRPLSEIATEHGAVEDLRPLVPFESEITDMLEGVRDYLASTPRRASIEIVPENFRAVRPDPPGAIPMPPEDVPRLPVPRGAYWQPGDGTTASWTWNAVTLTRAGDGAPRILESEALPVPPETELLLRCTANVRRGELCLLVGPPQGPAIASIPLRGAGTSEVRVHTGAHAALSFWLEAAGPVDARLEFDRLRTPAAVPGARFTVPHPGRWESTSADVRVDWTGSTVQLAGAVKRGPYLLKSYSIACVPHSRIELPLRSTVTRGALGVGILSGDQQGWLTTKSLPAGEWSGVLPFDTGENGRVYVVLYGERDGDLAAAVDWNTNIEATPSRLEPASGGAAPAAAAAPHAADTTPPASRWIERMRTALRGDVRYYCQKPWTDLHNFSVDGRMDVCCIATGESQTRYALGNLMTQSFQEVWNGPVAREFRRTVNSSTPLPPCRRCPMAYAYQGPLFDPSWTARRVAQFIRGGLRRLPYGIRVSPMATAVSDRLVSHLLFRGFKR
ncbi:MAG TPA: radical SAM/SPASM domain-containing protein [Vicinamibacterales bacterium]|nr:radical SAM/SPASM domain-containing protein [Vicinamibacterales bacterium]